MMLETISLLSGDNTSDSEFNNRLARLKELFEVDEHDIDLKQRFKLYEAIIAQIFEAFSCSIVLFNRNELKKLNSRIGSSIDNKSQLNNDGSESHFGSMHRVTAKKSTVDKTEKSSGRTNIHNSLVSCPLMSNGRVIGMVNIKKPKQKINYKFNDLELLEVVSYIIAKMIKLDQLHNLVSMRYPIFALQKSADATSAIGTIAESPHSVHTAKTLAKFIYQDVVKAGFGCENIVYIVSEIISELNNDLRNSR